MKISTNIKDNKSYKEGRKSGRTWPIKWNHLPGGPLYYNEFDREENRLYKDGFKKGLSENANKNHPVIAGLIIKANDSF